MRSFATLLVLVSSALAYPLAGRKAVVVPATCDPNVVKTVLSTLNSLNVPETIFLSTFETGLVESHFNNLQGGDRDSLGVFQQRPSQGYTDPTNVAHATTAFATQAAADLKKHPGRAAGIVAQDVQRSGFPQRYTQVQAQAQQLLNEARAGGALTCASGKGVAALKGASAPSSTTKSTATSKGSSSASKGSSSGSKGSSSGSKGSSGGSKGGSKGGKSSSSDAASSTDAADASSTDAAASSTDSADTASATDAASSTDSADTASATDAASSTDSADASMISQTYG